MAAAEETHLVLWRERERERTSLYLYCATGEHSAPKHSVTIASFYGGGSSERSRLCLCTRIAGASHTRPTRARTLSATCIQLSSAADREASATLRCALVSFPYCLVSLSPCGFALSLACGLPTRTSVVPASWWAEGDWRRDQASWHSREWTVPRGKYLHPLNARAEYLRVPPVPTRCSK